MTFAMACLCLALSQGPAEERTIIVIEGDKVPAVKVGDTLRFTQSGPSGRSEISAAVEGGAKLISTAKVVKIVNGRPLIGALTKEFEVKAEERGKAVVTISLKDVVAKTTRTKKLEFQIK
jgi:hypothetical protein